MNSILEIQHQQLLLQMEYEEEKKALESDKKQNETKISELEEEKKSLENDKKENEAKISQLEEEKKSQHRWAEFQMGIKQVLLQL